MTIDLFSERLQAAREAAMITRKSKLIHYSQKPLGEIRSVSQTDLPDFKPKGLWVSIDEGGEGWKAWCEAEQFGLERLACVTEIVLRETANILHIKSAADMRCAASLYAVDDGPFPGYWMDWRAIAVTYDGIIIAPYLHGMRHDPESRWYNGWDCASGCIWSASAIAARHLIREQAQYSPVTGRRE